MSLDNYTTGEKIVALFGGCLGVIILLLLGTIFNGVALMYLWAWFVVVPFALPALSLGQAIGLSSVVSFMTYQYIDVENENKTAKERLVSALGSLMVRPIGALIFGRVVYFFTYGQ